MRRAEGILFRWKLVVPRCRGVVVVRKSDGLSSYVFRAVVTACGSRAWLRGVRGAEGSFSARLDSVAASRLASGLAPIPARYHGLLAPLAKMAK